MTKTERDPLAQIRSQTAAIIPAYQDEKHIGDIVRRTRERLDQVLVVDDGSSDQRRNARAKPALKSLFTIKIAVKAKRSKQGWHTGSPWRVRLSMRRTDWIDKSPGSACSILMVNIFQKRSIGSLRRQLPRRSRHF